MASRAERVIVAADASKLGRQAFARICEIDQVDVVITGSDADPAIVADLRAAGVDVQLATRGLSTPDCRRRVTPTQHECSQPAISLGNRASR